MDSIPVTDAPPRPNAGNKARKRAPKACLSCRARKVRCDVSQRGRPCMNCYLDSETCVVTGRSSKFRRAALRDGGEDAEATFPPYGPDPRRQGPTAEEVVKSMARSGQPAPGGADGSPPFGSTDPLADPPAPLRPSPINHQTSATAAHARLHARPPLYHGTSPGSAARPSSTSSPWQPPDPNSDIVYSYYPFLGLSNLSNILPQDVNYLELQGCLRVPTRAVLDEFVQQYFLHVHAILPLFNEGDFWDLYTRQGGSGAPRFSLLVLQSLLFASCNFVSRRCIQALGYSSIRSARAALYRRAKLLYDFESESSPICIAQAALLLSFWSPPSGAGARKPSSNWLGTAIQHARAAGAHRYFDASSAGPARQQQQQQQSGRRQNALKRLWWCCVMRDRIVALCLRRGVQITRAQFDPDAHGRLELADLADEFCRSRVYDPTTKRALAKIAAHSASLCAMLTDVLVLVYPPDDSPGWRRPAGADESSRVRDAKTSMRRWYEEATFAFPDLCGGGGSSSSNSSSKSDDGDAEEKEGTGERRRQSHGSVTLYRNLMYMYYHSSRVALCHHEVLHLAAARARDISTINENRRELQDAATGVAECIRELFQRRLARWLSISAVACTALPLVLHILEVKLSPPGAATGDNSGSGSRISSGTDADAYYQSALKQHRLNILIEAMKTYRPQFDDVDRLSETIRHIVNLAQLDGPAPEGEGVSANGPGPGFMPGPRTGVMSDWTDVLTSHPSLYLRLALAVDLSLSRGRRHPEEGSLPASLSGLFPGGIGPVRLLFGGDADEAKARAPSSWSSTSHAPSPPPPPPNGRMPPAQAMKEFLAGDKMLQFGMQMGIDMEPDETAIAGLRMLGGLPDADSDGDDNKNDDGHPHRNSESGDPVAPAVISNNNNNNNGAYGAEPIFSASNPFGFQPFTAEEMDGLEAHVLEAFTLHNEPPPSSMAMDQETPPGWAARAAEVFGEALGLDTMWRDGRGDGQEENNEASRALLGATRGEWS